ncbi:endonuclease/exonuclease/phosphatase family protein [Flagellimonas nanhaiensis]|uniref:Endonuclease n=1 Tax=Flagellimonas nanhaiensis TaxID=2292706 RepID=A0A371JTF6_9FLAO|nr:endonuclease/exonuclease/phosphatase family protein [Allomuricauda nanhaiensis]RDY61078.1 endonuclease [Allomuricauda nanhaiensis]
MKKLSLFNKVIFFLNSFFVLVTLVSVVVPFVPVTNMPTLSILSLVVPVLILIHAFFIVYWLLRRKKQFLLSALIVILWYFTLGPFYQFSNIGSEKNLKKGNLSMMSFNVRSFNKYGWIANSELDNEIISLVKQSNPDIICFQEFSIIKIKEFDDYDYSFKTPDGTNKSFQTIFSKFPIIKGESLNFPNSINNGIFVDILFQQDTVRVYNIHLQSFSIVPEINTIKTEESSKLFAKSRRVMLKQYEQANLIRENMEQTHHKKILAGDFNNTQYSNVYRKIKGDMQDSYFKKGKGFGRTYNLLGFPIRIDYILADPEFEILSHQNFNEKLSDHYPVMATLRLNSNQ